MKLRSVLFAGAAAIAFTATAQADDYKGLYGKIGAGLNYIAPDRDFDAADSFNADGEFDYENGIAVISAIGYDYGDVRGEFEFSYRTNDIRHIDGDTPNFQGFDGDDITGDVVSYSIMANLLYDLDYFKQASGQDFVTPYFGGGVGIAFIDYDISGNVTLPAGDPGAALSDLTFDGTERSLVFQGIAGLAFDLAEGLALDLEYRYVGYPKRGVGASFDGGNTVSDVFTTLNAHNLLASLRWNFGAPAAAAPVAPQVEYKDCWDGSSVPVSASCPDQIIDTPTATPDPIQAIVYFDYDKSNLTPEASNLIREAVSRARDFDVEAVRVVGNTDTSGSSAYNQALSERRARVVRDALIANGISASIIQTSAQGENNLAKPTADGTREPLNRRSEITILFE